MGKGANPTQFAHKNNIGMQLGYFVDRDDCELEMAQSDFRKLCKVCCEGK